MSNERRNKGPEHIRAIIKTAKKEWHESIKKSTLNSDRYKELEEQCPPFLQIVFLFIDGDPQYIRTINLN